jgi:hypothetical protein
VLDGASLQATSVIDLGLDASAPPQALTMSPGGRYLAVVGYARAVLVDLAKGKVLSQFTGTASAGVWGNVVQASFASGSRRLLIASDQQVHSLALDNRLQLIEHTSSTIANEPLRALSVSADGDSYAAISDSSVYWVGSDASRHCVKSSLPPGVNVQQAALTPRHMVLMVRGMQDQQFKILRLPLAAPSKLLAAQ